MSYLFLEVFVPIDHYEANSDSSNLLDGSYSSHHASMSLTQHSQYLHRRFIVFFWRLSLIDAESIAEIILNWSWWNWISKYDSSLSSGRRDNREQHKWEIIDCSSKLISSWSIPEEQKFTFLINQLWWGPNKVSYVKRFKRNFIIPEEQNYHFC